jgi:hypothetical protein
VLPALRGWRSRTIRDQLDLARHPTIVQVTSSSAGRSRGRVVSRDHYDGRDRMKPAASIGLNERGGPLNEHRAREYMPTANCAGTGVPASSHVRAGARGSRPGGALECIA